VASYNPSISITENVKKTGRRWTNIFLADNTVISTTVEYAVFTIVGFDAIGFAKPFEHYLCNIIFAVQRRDAATFDTQVPSRRRRKVKRLRRRFRAQCVLDIFGTIAAATFFISVIIN